MCVLSRCLKVNSDSSSTMQILAAVYICRALWGALQCGSSTGRLDGTRIASKTVQKVLELVTSENGTEIAVTFRRDPTVQNGPLVHVGCL